MASDTFNGIFSELKMPRRARTKGSPNSLGYRMPAEWEPHEATWLAWPHELTDWPGKFAPIPWVYAEIVRHLSRVERVHILIEDAQAESRARAMLRKAGANLSAVKFSRVPTDRGWIRDFGPILVKNAAGRVGVTHWVFNGWAKYDDFLKDASAFAQVNRKSKHPVWRPTLGDRPIVLEGGSIDVNGRGTLMTTEECLLSPVQARNPGLAREELERVLRDYLGAMNVIWLKNGIAGDDTHGHVDDLARFVNPTTVVVVTEEDGADPNYAPLLENLQLLLAARDQSGHPLRVVKLPMPAPVFFDSQRLPASYANFYIANGLVLVPMFSDLRDREALNILAELFPGREVLGIPCRDLVLGLGTLHCMTQQEPARG
jgi:agmatine deiminase